jgi:hypothetical protein
MKTLGSKVMDCWRSRIARAVAKSTKLATNIQMQRFHSQNVGFEMSTPIGIEAG